MSSAASAALYRRILKEARHLRCEPARRKIAFNTRQLFLFYRGSSDPAQLQALREDGEAAVRTLRWLRDLPEASR